MNETKICYSCYDKQATVKEHTKICQKCYEKQYSMMLVCMKNRSVFYPEIDEINEKIYLGNSDGSREKNKLKEFGVKAIMVCGSLLEKCHPDDFEYKVFDINDTLNQKIDVFFDEAFDFMDKHDKVYVHCAAGISRSASFVIAYLMKKNKWTYQQAYEFVLSKRSAINPNSNFVSQLKNYESNLK